MAATVALFSLAVAGLAVTGALAAAAVRLDSMVSFVLAVYLCASAEVVVTTLMLSLGHDVNAAGYLAAEGLLLVGAAAAWHLRGRPKPPPLPRFDVGAAARAHPTTAALAVVVALAIAYELAIAVGTPPNNGDSLTYHLTRAAAWLRHGGLYRIPNSQPEENDFPPNAEIQILYTFALLHRDTAAAAVQWLAQLALVIAIYGCARRLGFWRAPSLFAALLAPTLSLVALESMTTQNDLLAAAYVVVAAYFLGRGGKEIAFFGVAVGLALGTKITAAFALLPLALLAAASLPRRQVLAAATAAIAGFALLGSYAYVSNVVATGHPTGAQTGEPGANLYPRVTARGTFSTVARDLYRFADLSGVDIDYRHLLPFTGAARHAFLLLHIPTNPPESTGYPFAFTLNERANEDLSFFGPLGLLLVVPLAFGVVVRSLLRRAEAGRAAFASALPFALVGVALTSKYGAQGRWLLPGVLLTLPLAALLYRHRLVAAAAAIIGATFLALALAHDDTKPTGLRGTTAIWTLTRPVAQQVQAPAEYEFIGERLAQVVPDNATVGVVDDEHDPDYLLYGPKLSRSVVWLPHARPLAHAPCALRWIYVGRNTPVPRHGSAWTSEQLDSAGTLLKRSGASCA